jgi:hypothetical protein
MRFMTASRLDNPMWRTPRDGTSSRRRARAVVRRIRSMVLTVVVGCASINAYSGTVVCSGTVVRLAYHQPDAIFVQLSSMNTPVLICSMDVEWVVPGTLAGNTSVSACRAMYAALLSAKLADRPINVFYMDGDTVPAACGAFASWTRVNVRYWEQ